MSSEARVTPERYQLTVDVASVMHPDYADLPVLGDSLHLSVINLRNRPVPYESMAYLGKTTLTLCHSLITGLRTFPEIPYYGACCCKVFCSPFGYPRQKHRENTVPSPITEEPVRLMADPADSRPPAEVIWIPHLPEKTDLAALSADPRNHVRTERTHGDPVIRVISPVYSSEREILEDQWRVSHYTPNGQMIMSVLCSFIKDSVSAVEPRGMKRKRKLDRSPAAKRIRV